MEKAALGIQITALVIQVFAVILLGLEIYGHMDPDTMIVEASIIGICLIVIMICTFYRLYAKHRKSSSH